MEKHSIQYGTYNCHYDVKRKFVKFVAKVLLIPFAWLATGADSFAQLKVAEKDPKQFMKNISSSPKMLLAKSALDNLKSNSSTKRQAVPRKFSLVEHPTHAERRAVINDQKVLAEMREIKKDKKLSQSGYSLKIKKIQEKLTASHALIIDGFNNTEKLFESKKVSGDIIVRQKEHRLRYIENWNRLQNLLREADENPDSVKRDQAFDDAINLLSTSHDQRPEQPFDVNTLPFAVSKPVKRPPRTDWNTSSVSPGYSSTLDRVVESFLDFIVSPAYAAPAPVSPADLAETEDVQITPEIQALAASLGNKPLAIYDWVRNNIEFYATHGSVQGSQLTLELKRGNATDISSLLIALLRAAGIPARYVMGTINMPAADVLDWLGGVPNTDFAQEVLGSGAIPNVAIVDGSGSIISFDIEHVWVEAYVDMIPSRGALHVDGDTWVKMDASFKKYNIVPASNLINDVPIDGALASFQASLTVDESLGQLTDYDDDATKDVLSDWAIQANNYLDTNGIAQTPAAVLGSKNIIQKNHSSLPGTLPFNVVSHGSQIANLPASIRHKVQVIGYASSFDRALGSPDFNVTVNLSSLGSKRLGLTFASATPGDEAVLQAARDSGAASLPISSVNVVPKIKVNDTIINSGSSIRMGSDYFLDVIMNGPDGSKTLQYDVIAGDEIVVGVTGNGFNSDVLQKRLDNNPVVTSAEYLHQVNLHYWAEVDLLNANSAKGMDGYIVRLPSVGLFSSPLTVSYLFGFPNTGVYASKFMDVKWSYIGAAANTPETKVALVKQAGFNGSYMEGTTFDQFEGTLTGKTQVKAIDSMKLLAAASHQGIPLYRITSANKATVFPLLNLDPNVESNINSALATGQTVLAPRDNVNLGPWSGTGYILQNEATGEGAYLISGGLNGGGMPDCVEELVWKIVGIVALVILAIILAILLYYLLVAIAAALAGILAGVGAAAAELWAGFVLMLRALAVASRFAPAY